MQILDKAIFLLITIVLPLKAQEISLSPFIREDNASVLKGIVEQHPNSVNRFCKDGGTPLIMAIRNGSFRCVTVLIDAGANVKARSLEGNTIIEEALAGEGDVELVTYLLDKGAEIGNGALTLSVISGNVEMIRLLLQYNCPKGSTLDDGINLIEQSILDRRFEIANMLWDSGITKTIFAAAALSKEDYLKAEFERTDSKEIKNNYGWSILHWAAIGGRVPIVEKCIKLGCNPTLRTSNGCPVFFLSGSSEVAEYLYRNGWAFLREKNSTGDTALHTSVRLGTSDFIEWLIARDVSLDVKNEDGNTPITLASALGHMKILEIMLRKAKSYDRNTRNNKDETALHCAAAEAFVNTVDCLLQNGFASNAVDSMGNTPLHRVLMKRTSDCGSNFQYDLCDRIHVSQRLQLFGANCLIRNKEGVTSFDLAEKSNLSVYKSILKYHKFSLHGIGAVLKKAP